MEVIPRKLAHAAACLFYTAIYGKDPSVLTYNFTRNSVVVSGNQDCSQTCGI